MTRILTIDAACDDDRPRIGGKAVALMQLHRAGFAIPETVFLTTAAYDAFVDAVGIRERIQLELHRKPLDQMRWEEIWDCATRIRHLFLTRAMPDSMRGEVEDMLHGVFAGKPMAVRSSAPEEDSARTSFAGLHASFIHVTGAAAVIDSILKVWSSLWSDAALLYRNEIGLDVETSSMGVVLQETLAGDRSGVAFTMDPSDDARGVIEAVYGLNEGLVDGRVAPDRWRCRRAGEPSIVHEPTDRAQRAVPSPTGTRIEALPDRLRVIPPLMPDEVHRVFDMAMAVERLHGMPQDVEWTYVGDRLVLLQSRPISTAAATASADDPRGWYLSLHRSFENLRQLRERIEHRWLPEMIQEADALSRIDPTALSDEALVQEIEHRVAVNSRWVDIYWSEFIPFAHGIRLFGQIYNERVRPQDPYEFMRLLGQTGLASIERNDRLQELADMVRSDTGLRQALVDGTPDPQNTLFQKRLDRFLERFGDLSCPVTGGRMCGQGPDALVRILLEMADHATPGARQLLPDIDRLLDRYLEAFPPEERSDASALLDLARTSYRFRDDDNMHIGRIEARLLAAVNEARRRLIAGTGDERLRRAVDGIRFGGIASAKKETEPGGRYTARARQLVGQPAGPGVAAGTARVVNDPSMLSEFQHGEILVVDAVDPNMTYIVPLAAAVVERRGGMLIHGAIIAREYGLPCVTGVADATDRIRTGDGLTVDGFLGIVTVSGRSGKPTAAND